MARRRRGGRIRRVGSRIRHRFRRGHRVKMSMTTKLLHAAYTAIAVSPRIEDTLLLAQNQLNVNDYTTRILEDYTGFDMAGNFQPQRLARGYGPILGAFALSKIVGFARKRWKF